MWRWVTTSFLKIVTKYFDGKFGTDIVWDEHWFWILKLALNIVIADMFFNDSFSLLQKIRASQVIYSLFFIFLNVFFFILYLAWETSVMSSLSIKSLKNFYFFIFTWFHLYGRWNSCAQSHVLKEWELQDIYCYDTQKLH